MPQPRPVPSRRTSVRKCPALAAALVVSCVVFAPAPAAEVPFEGDRDSLALVLAAVANHRAAVRQGAVRADMRAVGEGLLGGVKAEMTLRWRGDLGRASFRIYDPTLRDGEVIGHSWSPLLEIVRAREATYFWSPERASLREYRLSEAETDGRYPMMARCWPRSLWFAGGGSDFHRDEEYWDLKFDPARLDANRTTVLITARAGGGEVRLERFYRNGNRGWAVASADAGWNVTSYGSELIDDDHAGHRGTFEWERDPGGVYHVRRMTDQRFGRTFENLKIVREFSDFRTAVPDGDAQFTKAALGLPKTRYEVTTWTPAGYSTRSVGRKASGVDEARLRALGQLLRDGSLLTGAEAPE